MFQCGTVKTTVRVRACSFSVIMFVAWGLCLVFTVLWNRQFRAELAARGTSVSARDLLFRPNFTVWKDKTPRKGKRRNEKEQDQWDKEKKKAEKERRKLAIRFKRKSEGGKASERICGSVHPSVRTWPARGAGSLWLWLLQFYSRRDLTNCNCASLRVGVRESNVPASLWLCWYVNRCKKTKDNVVFSLVRWWPMTDNWMHFRVLSWLEFVERVRFSV
jgi:hypothetical protein